MRRVSERMFVLAWGIIYVSAIIVQSGIDAWGYDEARLQARSILTEPTEAIPSPEASETEWGRYIANQWRGAINEARLPDGARVDTLTATTAYEIDRCKPGKNYEAVGQALYYRASTNRQGGVILLMGQKPLKQEIIHYQRCLVACREAGLRLLVMDVRTGNFNQAMEVK